MNPYPLSTLLLLSVTRLCVSEPTVWMIPPADQDGHCIRELFTKPGQWEETRTRVAVIAFADHRLHKQFTVIQSWVGAPLQAVPETAEWTFTRSVRDFCRRFAETGQGVRGE